MRLWVVAYVTGQQWAHLSMQPPLASCRSGTGEFGISVTESGYKERWLQQRETRAMFLNLPAFPKMLGQFGVFAFLEGCGGLCSSEYFLRIQKPKIS